MVKTGRKNAAGGWVLGEFLQRITSAGMLFMAVVGIALGFLIRGMPVFEGSVGSHTSGVMLGAMVLAFVVFYAYCRRVDATWGRGLEAERQIGDFIEHAVAQRGCGFAHDVKEALGGRGGGGRRPCRLDTGRRVGRGDEVELGKQAAVPSGVAPGGAERGPGPKSSRDISPGSRRARDRGSLQ